MVVMWRERDVVSYPDCQDRNKSNLLRRDERLLSDERGETVDTAVGETRRDETRREWFGVCERECGWSV